MKQIVPNVRKLLSCRADRGLEGGQNNFAINGSPESASIPIK